MRFSSDRRPAVTSQKLAALLAGLLLTTGLGTGVAAASRANVSARVMASAARAVPRPLASAAALSTRADRALVANARALSRCTREHPRNAARCGAARRAVQRAGGRLARAERFLASVAHRSTKGARAARAARRAPRLSVSGQSLRWPAVDGLYTYVLMRQLPGQAARYSVVEGTSVTPPPVAGATVDYSVRTTAQGSAWSPSVSIAYAPVAVTQELPDTQSAPTVTISAGTLSWNAVADVGTYILVRTVAGQAPQYSVVAGTSTTPAPVPGETVAYSVRTAVDGSAWSPQVTISYPAATPTPTPEAPSAETPPSTGLESSPALQIGLNSGTEPMDLAATATLGAKLVRLAFEVGESPAEIEPAIAAYAAEGVRVLPVASFWGRMPTAAEAQGLAAWAKAFGPGGTFWADRSDGALAIQSIEFGNETDYSGQYNDEPGDASYTARAQTYAIRLKEAAEAIAATGDRVGLLAQEDDQSGDWISGMYSAVPDLTKYVAGWTIQPYGGREYNYHRFEDMIKQTAEHGASAVPIDVTEWGVTTDNGKCLEFNEGLNPCMSYAEAAEQLTSTTAWMKELLGSRLGMFMMYQVRDQRATGTTNNWQMYFGALQHELQSKGPYTAAVESLLRS